LRNPLVHSTACARRSALLAIGGYGEEDGSAPEFMAEDCRLWSKLAVRNWLGVLPEVVLWFRRHGGRISVQRPEENRNYGILMIASHLKRMKLETLSDSDALFSVGHSESFPLERGLHVLAQWEHCWRSDSSLTAEQFAELRGLTALRRKKLLRSNARKQPLSFLLHAAAYVSSSLAARGVR
jgi:hypothetical protein